MNGAGHDDTNRNGRAQICWPLVLYVVVTLVLAYPLSIDPAGRLLGASADMLLMIWMLMWDTYAFIHQPFSIFDANIYFRSTTRSPTRRISSAARSLRRRFSG